MKRYNLKLFFLSATTLPVMVIIYSQVIAAGLRISLPAALSMKLYKLPLPLLSNLERYKNYRDLDLAVLLAMLMLCVLLFLSNSLLELLLFGPRTEQGLVAVAHAKVLSILCSILFSVDLAIFYRGISETSGLFDEGGGTTPILATIGYGALMFAIAYAHVMFKHRVF
jgi:hypothetical protein